MISYQTYCQIQDDHQRLGLSARQIAEQRGLHRQTVSKWLAEPQYRRPRTRPRTRKLDPFKADILRWLQSHRLSAQQVLQRLRQHGFSGGHTIVSDYVRQIRPRRPPAYLTLSFAPGECAQVDWGSYGTIPVGSSTRKLSFFVLVLCYSRLMYLEFTLSQSLEQFLSCHLNAFQALGGVPKSIMIDNLKSAVLEHRPGQPPILQPRYQELAAHYGFTITPCGVRQPQAKGRVENGVGYVKKNFLQGLELGPFAALNPAARQWLDTVANVRTHGATHQRPVDRFVQEQAQLLPLPPVPFDPASRLTVRANNQFRVRVDTNRYSVPAEYASTRVQVNVYPDRLCVYSGQRLIARHNRCYDRHQDIEDPEHPRALLAQRRSARDQQLLARFLSLCPQAEAYYQRLLERRLHATGHVQKILALSEQYGLEAVVRALRDALAFEAYSSEYMINWVHSRARLRPDPTPLQVPRAGDALELSLPEPDLSIYDPERGSR